jgi:hypothetical protein
VTEQPPSPRPEDDTAPMSAVRAEGESALAPEPPTAPLAAPGPAVAPEPAALPPLPTAPQPAPTPLDRAATLAAERPEVAVGGAFAGGFLFAMILRRLAR